MLDALLVLACIIGGYIAFLILYLALAWFFPGILRPAWWLLLKVVYVFKVYHAERVPHTGAALVLANHVSYLDWLVVWAASPRPVRFVLWSGYYRRPLLRFWLSFVRHRTIRIDNRTATPHAVMDALGQITAVLNAGEAVLIFPEGRLTRNGQMRPFGRGIEHILKKATVPISVVPLASHGLWGSIFSHKGGRIIFRWPDSFRRRVSVMFGEPLPQTSSAAEVRASIGECLADLAIVESDHDLLTPCWYIRTASRWRNMFRPGLIDGDRKLKIGEGLVAAWALSAWLRPLLAGRASDGIASLTQHAKTGTTPSLARPANAIGIWLPTSLGSTLANIALAFLRIPSVNLNYTAGPDALRSACEQAGLTTVITAKRFLTRVPLDLPDSVTRIYLEDSLAGISKSMKLWRFLCVLLLPAWLLERLIGVHKLQPDDLLTIVFSSGSTGAPKGVMLSHRNVASNGHAFDVGVDLRRHDIMLAALPFFHSFGYTVCLWAPVGVGMTAVYQSDPRAAREVGELCAKHHCTLMLGTATFIRFYLRKCGSTDFATIRLLICGAEKLPVKLQEEFFAKFKVRLLEGYGCTELSPVASTNLHDVDVSKVRQVAHRLGTVGQPIPGVAVRAFDAATKTPLPPETEGVLAVKGPNVMMGYLHQPERTREVIVDGWYLTGDRGLVESDGFIRITGRDSRFAKIAGEMVPLEKIEEELLDAVGLHERTLAVAAVPDEKRGERVVVLYTSDAADNLDAALASLKPRGLPNLWIPDRRDCHQVESIPSLGTGKLDLRGIANMAVKSSTQRREAAETQS